MNKFEAHTHVVESSHGFTQPPKIASKGDPPNVSKLM